MRVGDYSPFCQFLHSQDIDDDIVLVQRVRDDGVLLDEVYSFEFSGRKTFYVWVGLKLFRWHDEKEFFSRLKR